MRDRFSCNEVPTCANVLLRSKVLSMQCIVSDTASTYRRLFLGFLLVVVLTFVLCFAFVFSFFCGTGKIKGMPFHF